MAEKLGYRVLKSTVTEEGSANSVVSYTMTTVWDSEEQNRFEETYLYELYEQSYANTATIVISE